MALPNVSAFTYILYALKGMFLSLNIDNTASDNTSDWRTYISEQKGSDIQTPTFNTKMP